MPVASSSFGKTKYGEDVTAYTLTNSSGISAVFLDYGATLQSLSVPNSCGGRTDVVLGYDSIGEYEQNGGYLGATIGRMGNRVGGAAFSLGGRRYELAANNGLNHLHGGLRGFDKYIWRADPSGDRVSFSRLSPDGEENYPGNLSVRVSYILEGTALRIVYDADTDADTIVNLTNHSYFNLNGGGSALEHELKINAESFLELGEGTLPTGRRLPVEGTPFDFRSFKSLGRDIGLEDAQLRLGGGYDHNFILSSAQAAVVRSRQSGIEMKVFTDMPGMQLYSANFLSARRGKGGHELRSGYALCLETQLFPNAMNCYGFPSPVLHAGEHLHSETSYSFELW